MKVKKISVFAIDLENYYNTFKLSLLLPCYQFVFFHSFETGIVRAISSFKRQKSFPLLRI